MNKYNHPKNVAASGGIIVVVAFILGVLTYIAFNTLQIGQEVLSSNNIVGYVDSIDTYGNSFKVKPTIDESNQNFYFYDTKKGIFNQGDSFEIL